MSAMFWRRRKEGENEPALSPEIVLDTLSFCDPTKTTVPSLKRAATCCSTVELSVTERLRMGAPKRGTNS